MTDYVARECTKGWRITGSDGSMADVDNLAEVCVWYHDNLLPGEGALILDRETRVMREYVRRSGIHAGSEKIAAARLRERRNIER